MSASNATIRELRALREVAHFLLPLVCCEFCGKPLLDPKLADKVFGDKAHSPLKDLRLTVHHRNGKHGDNRRTETFEFPNDDAGRTFALCGNTSLTHRPCHNAYEAKLTSKKTVRRSLRERADELLSICTIPDAMKECSTPEWNFIDKMSGKWADSTKKFTLYEIRRLKKLAKRVI